MQKHKTPRKPLSLRTETVRWLAPDELGFAGGRNTGTDAGGALPAGKVTSAACQGSATCNP